jgi:hypothetical protein
LITPPELFELKVLVEAHDWHDVATLMASVDRALDPHQTAMSGDRRWSVVANRLPAERAHELLEFLGRRSADRVDEPGSTTCVDRQPEQRTSGAPTPSR